MSEPRLGPGCHRGSRQRRVDPLATALRNFDARKELFGVALRRESAFISLTSVRCPISNSVSFAAVGRVCRHTSHPAIVQQPPDIVRRRLGRIARDGIREIFLVIRQGPDELARTGFLCARTLPARAASSEPARSASKTEEMAPIQFRALTRLCWSTPECPSFPEWSGKTTTR